MKIHKNKLKKYIREVLKEAYLRKNGLRLKDDHGNDILPVALKPEIVFDKIEDYFENKKDGSGTFNDYRIKYLTMDYQARAKKQAEGRPTGKGINIYSPTLLTIPVIQAGLKAKDKYIGPTLSTLEKRYGKGIEYVIEPGDFEGMELKGIDVRKEILPRLDGSHQLPSTEKGVPGAPFKIEVLGDESLTVPDKIKTIVPGDDTVPRVSLRNTAPLYDDDETEEAPGVYPKTTDVRPDYESNMTMDMHPEDLATLSAAERSRIAAKDAGLDFGEFLPTGVETGYDFFFDEPIKGEDDYMEKNYPHSKHQKYMKSYKK